MVLIFFSIFVCIGVLLVVDAYNGCDEGFQMLVIYWPLGCGCIYIYVCDCEWICERMYVCMRVRVIVEGFYEHMYVRLQVKRECLGSQQLWFMMTIVLWWVYFGLHPNPLDMPLECFGDLFGYARPLLDHFESLASHVDLNSTCIVCGKLKCINCVGHVSVDE